MMGHNGKMEDGCLQKYFTCCHVSETKLKEKIAAVIHCKGTSSNIQFLSKRDLEYSYIRV
jgi:hypothetical protein